ncbi:MAG: carbohydrate kinase family protein [Chitinispirillaceae bacterium]|nr:carbohydrate kinase family protein [Chitinispirillaceae bacterium]
MERRRILTLGPLIVDIITSPLERMLRSGEGVATQVGIHPGGCSYNVSVDCAQLDDNRFDITCIGAVGSDIFHDFFSRELIERGVRPRLFPFPGERTGANIILQVQGDERRFHTDAGANLQLNPEEVCNVIGQIQPDCFCLGELSLLGACERAIGRFCEAARRCGALVVADVVVMPDAVWKDLFDIAGSVDLFHCNDDEAFLISGTNDVHSALRFLSERGFRLPVISRGKRGLSWAWNGFRYSLAPFACKEIDATGAGDAFVSGTVIRLLDGGIGGASGTVLPAASESAITEALLYGAASGATAVTRFGCTGAVTGKNVDALCEQQGESVRASLTKEPL